MNILGDMKRLRHALKKRDVPTTKWYVGRVANHCTNGIELKKDYFNGHIQARLWTADGKYGDEQLDKYSIALKDACKELEFTIEAARMRGDYEINNGRYETVGGERWR